MKIFENINKVHAKTTLAFAVCTVLAVAPTHAQDDAAESPKGVPGKSTSSQSGAASGSLDQQDQKFVQQAAKGGMKEVKMAKMGLQKASNEGVKQYAQRLLDDHTKANTELKQIASSKGITLPDAQAALSGDTGRTQVREKESAESGESSDHQGHMKKLETLSGAEFDREFVRMAVQDHQKGVKEFEKAAQSGQDPEIKAFAQKTAPKLREHLQQAKALQAQVGGSDSSSGTGAPGSASGSTSASSGSRQTSGSADSSEGQNSSGQGGSDAINKARGNTGGDTPAGAPATK